MKDNLIYMAYSVYHYAVMLPTRVYTCIIKYTKSFQASAFHNVYLFLNFLYAINI